MSRQHVLPFLLFAVLCSCEQHKAVDSKGAQLTDLIIKVDTIPQVQYQLDTSTIAVLPVDKSKPWLFKGDKSIALTDEELSLVDKILIDCVDMNNARRDTTKQFSEFIYLKKYKRQYIPFVDIKGERKVYVNCFCIADGRFSYWKKMLVEVDDGGSCYFRLTVNLSKLNFEQFSTNGYG